MFQERKEQEQKNFSSKPCVQAKNSPQIGLWCKVYMERYGERECEKADLNQITEKKLLNVKAIGSSQRI